jgi:hypothetical protein
VVRYALALGRKWSLIEIQNSFFFITRSSELSPRANEILSEALRRFEFYRNIADGGVPTARADYLGPWLHATATAPDAVNAAAAEVLATRRIRTVGARLLELGMPAYRLVLSFNPSQRLLLAEEPRDPQNYFARLGLAETAARPDGWRPVSP